MEILLILIFKKYEANLWTTTTFSGMLIRTDLLCDICLDKASRLLKSAVGSSLDGRLESVRVFC